MKNINNVVKASQNIGKGTRLPLYYSIKEKAVYTEAGADRFFVTYLINPNAKEDIEAVVNRWLNM